MFSNAERGTYHEVSMSFLTISSLMKSGHIEKTQSSDSKTSSKTVQTCPSLHEYPHNGLFPRYVLQITGLCKEIMNSLSFTFGSSGWVGKFDVCILSFGDT